MDPTYFVKHNINDFPKEFFFQFCLLRKILDNINTSYNFEVIGGIYFVDTISRTII